MHWRLPRAAVVSVSLIALAALGIRIYSLQQYVNTHSRQALGAIPFLFEPGNIAYSLASGRGFGSPFRVDTGPTAWMTPVYPMLLAATFRVFGSYSFHAFLAAALMNIVFSTCACVPLFFAAKKIAGPVTSAIAASLWAIFPNAIVFPYESLWDASLAAMLGATILWATLALPESGRVSAWYGYGLLWGFTLMTSATLAAVFPFLFGWLAYRMRRNDRKWIEKPALAAGVAILCCIPWTARNYARFQTLVPLRSVMGLSLWEGNNDRADGLTPVGLHPISNSAEREKYVELGEVAYMREKQDQAIRFMLSHPGREISLIKTRFIAIWTGGSARPMTDFRRARSQWFRWTLFFNVFTSIAGLAGIVILWRRRNPWTFPVAVFPLLFPIAYYVTLAPPRYRHPMDPVLALLSAVCLKTICQTIGRSSIRSSLIIK